MTNQFIFTPVAQNTIIRPLAQAVCIVNGGQETPYVDTADKKDKRITLDNLFWVSLEMTVDGQKKIIDGYQAAFLARHQPIKIQVNVNDIPVMISPKTTVTQAMNQYKRKYAKVNNMRISRGVLVRQKD